MIPEIHKDSVARNYGYDDWSKMEAVSKDSLLGFDLLLHAIEEAALLYCKSKWISVKERLPEERLYVLCYIKLSDDGTRDIKKVLTQRQGVWDDYDSYVTHWMPLPPQPEFKP